MKDRRPSLRSILSRRKSSTISTRPLEPKPESANFFSLPAELRNEVYLLATRDLKLTLRTDADKTQRFSNKITDHTSLTRPVPSLLLVSRQCRNEALPILLTVASIDIRVVDFDFKDVVRVEGSLYATELKALRRNQNLWVTVMFSAGGKRVEEKLRRWATHRSSALGRLPWHYRVAARRSPQSQSRKGGPDTSTTFGDYQLCVNMLDDARLGMPEGLVWELQAIRASVDESFREQQRAQE